MGRSAERRKKTQTTSRTLNATGSEPAWRRGPRAAAFEPLAEKRDGVDLERSEQVPVDAARRGCAGRVATTSGGVTRKSTGRSFGSMVIRSATTRNGWAGVRKGV